MAVTLLRGLFCALLIAWASPALPQDPGEALGAAEEPPATEPADIEAEVRAVIAGLAGDDGPDAALAVTASDTQLDHATLELILLPLPLDALANEALAWHDALQKSVDDLSAAQIELLELNRADEDKGESAESATEKAALLERISGLQNARTVLIDRLKLVVDDFEAKGADPGDVDVHRKYIAAVNGVKIDVSDTETALNTIQTWLTSEQGGWRILKQAGTFAAFVTGTMMAGWLISHALNFSLKRTSSTSTLLRRFLRVGVRRIAVLVGVLLGLSALNINISPLIAAVGAMGFILAFALQNTLSNFASGMLIMIQRPFDVGDDVDAAGITGTIEKVSLFSTHMSTDENKKVIVPNNMIWDGIIVNATGAPTRRLSIEVEVNAELHSMEESEHILAGVMEAHPDVLKDPAPEVKLSAMGADSMTFVCWPWVTTEKKDEVRWALVAEFGRKLNVLSSATKAETA